MLIMFISLNSLSLESSIDFLIVLSESCALLVGCSCTGRSGSLSATGAGSAWSHLHPSTSVHPVVDSRSGVSLKAQMET